jgi:hypothetical protein
MISLKGNRPEPDETARNNGVLVADLQRRATYGASNITAIPMYLWIVLEHSAWQHFADEHTNKVYDYCKDEFEKFALTRRPAGLGVENGVAGLILICDQVGGEDGEKAKRLLREAIPAEKPHGGKREKATQVDNVNLPKGGNSEAYLLRRLKRDYPDLAAKVVAGEMSARAAGIQAGFVKPVISLRPTVPGFLKAARAYLTLDERVELKESLS